MQAHGRDSRDIPRYPDMNLSLSIFMFSQEGKRDEEATKVGNESDVLDFIEQRVNLSLAGLAARTGDSFKVCVYVYRMVCRL